ncbi:DUF4160 domain-containing protein [Candidatus Venteria ishoeyi]|uniref:DUF4160 domain-containing protein n=1 Tax=Candidatus Venteria ishoeyi TaxID=1899563 RepID=A0A1H6FF92_9GAMM|nr:DUF4160 domain-containing protein [Candidatus Venteria ishoeyi]SEH07705.1 Uncharacterised protein [Candidatus Venteria ishoeyi]
MPVVFRYQGYRFFFFSNEGNPLEPCHIHVRKGGAVAKFWLEPEVKLAESYEMASSELRKLSQLIKQHEALIKEKWNVYFSQ